METITNPDTRAALSAGFRRRVYAVLESRGGGRTDGEAAARAPYVVETLLVLVILLNTVSLILWTVPRLEASYSLWFHLVEHCTVAVFAVEYGLRLWAAPEADAGRNPWRQRWRHVVGATALIDLAALLPSVAAVAVLLLTGDSLTLSFLLALRILTRSAKLARYFPGGRRLGLALRLRGGQLATAVAALLVVLVIAAALMYFAESAAQPEVFNSIPAAMWWSVVTLTTVGYGDTVPQTGAGRLLAAVIAVLGIGLFALPAGILSAAMMEANAAGAGQGEATAGVCPHCGEPLGSGAPLAGTDG